MKNSKGFKPTSTTTSTVSKAGVTGGIGARKKKPSEQLEEETKKMEEKLHMLKDMMSLEKDRRQNMKYQKDGSIWRSGTNKQKL